jgi:LPS export ABC transporter protein LptC
LVKILPRSIDMGRLLLSGVLVCAVTACQAPKPIAQPSPVPSGKLESYLKLNKATLEQTDAKGQSLWKIQVEDAIYTPDRKNADLTGIKGNLFTDGKIVLQVSADKGEIQKDGEIVILRQNIIAVDPRNKAVIRSNEAEWRPKESLLVIRKDFKGSHPQLEVTAKEGQYETRRQRVDLSGNIVGVSAQKRLQLKTEHLFWLIAENKILSDQLMTVSRFQDKQITDQIVTKQAELQLNTKLLQIRENVDFKSLKPPLQIVGTLINWQYEKRLVDSSQPLKIVDYEKQITITGNQGKVDLNQNMAWMTGGAQGISKQNQAKLFANNLTWNMASQTLEALGNVVYEQSKSPKFNLTGERAIGILQNNSVIVTSDKQDRVVTEIYPEPTQSKNP